MYIGHALDCVVTISLTIGAHKIGFKKEDGAELIKLLNYTQQKVETKVETLENEILEILREEERELEDNEPS